MATLSLEERVVIALMREGMKIDCSTHIESHDVGKAESLLEPMLSLPCAKSTMSSGNLCWFELKTPFVNATVFMEPGESNRDDDDETPD